MIALIWKYFMYLWCICDFRC